MATRQFSNWASFSLPTEIEKLTPVELELAIAACQDRAWFAQQQREWGRRDYLFARLLALESRAQYIQGQYASQVRITRAVEGPVVGHATRGCAPLAVVICLAVAGMGALAWMAL